MKNHEIAAHARALEVVGAREVSELRWKATLEFALRTIGKTEADLRASAKSAPWKIAVAAWLKTRTDVSNGWAASALNLGAPAAASRNLTTFRHSNPERNRWWMALTSISAT